MFPGDESKQLITDSIRIAVKLDAWIESSDIRHIIIHAINQQLKQW